MPRGLRGKGIKLERGGRYWGTGRKTTGERFTF